MRKHNWPKQPWWITKGNKNHTNSVQLLLLKVVLNTINQPNGISAFRWSSVCISFCNSPRFLGSIINSYCLKFQISSYQNCDWMKSQISSFQNSDWLKFQISSSPQNSDWLKFQISSSQNFDWLKLQISSHQNCDWLKFQISSSQKPHTSVENVTL